MSLQVDLLKKTERRYQGIVSMKVIVLGAASLLIGIAILVFSLAGISRVTLNANLDRAQREWDRMEPQAEIVRRAGIAVKSNQDVLKQISAWSGEDAVPMYQVFRSVQSEIPKHVQFNSIVASVREDSDQKPFHLLQINGRAMGELVAVDTKRKLNSNESVRAFCEEVRLVSSQRGLGDEWTFSFEGKRMLEGEQK